MPAAYRLTPSGIEPRVALLSHFNFGSHDDPGARKMRQVREFLPERRPDLNVDGEMQGDTAWDGTEHADHPHSTLSGHENLFVFPALMR